MNRRSFLAGTVPAALGVRSAHAQRLPVVGWLSYATAAAAAGSRAIFLEGMAENGYLPGRTFTLEERYADERIDRVADLARSLAEQPANAIATYGAAVKSTLDAIKTVPVLYSFSGDPVDAGFAASLTRPGRNASGVSYLSAELNGKRIELLREFMPRLQTLAVLANPDHPGEGRDMAVCRLTAASLDLGLVYYPARNRSEMESAFDRMPAANVGAIMALSDIVTVQNRVWIANAAARLRVPVIASWAIFARSGFLFSYGPKVEEVHRQLARQVERVLKGADPATLPIEQPVRFELVINAKTAGQYAIAIPPAIFARADEIIE
ncbi:MAG: hypothetical protein EPO55_24785 [Reyranella sp.]|uniref:ABC transporter substrate-binding protein n=1 Tax=Reyranella sp. TaxID=1929291 RepID=UPI001207E183|nr:ABC transporter substrate-binding protein [Reyranella sp.]TAJ35684.1 MAG: hypothetical protein EPO55_24785 [Reyranella sp.]